MIIGALIYIIFFSRAAIVNRKLSKIEKKKILDCQTGDYVKVKGQVKYLGTPMLAPFSGRPCVYYYVIVEEHRVWGDGRNKSGRWYTIIEEEHGNDFIIKDGNSHALIGTENSKSNLKTDKTYHTGTFDNPIELLKKYLEKHGIASADLSNLNKSVRYKEGIIEEGETVSAAGKVAWKNKSELKFEIPVERILVVGPNEKEPVYLSNVPDSLKSN